MGPGYGMMRGFGGLGGFGGFGVFGWILQILVLIAVVYLVVYAVRAFSGNQKQQHSSATNDALRILAERFARGEISAEEYKTMKDHLK